MMIRAICLFGGLLPLLAAALSAYGESTDNIPELMGCHESFLELPKKDYPDLQFRHVFEVDKEVLSATWAGTGRVFLNGGEIAHKNRCRVDASMVKEGENVLAISSPKSKRRHEVIGRLTLELAGGEQQIIQTGSAGWVMNRIPAGAGNDWAWLESDLSTRSWNKVDVAESADSAHAWKKFLGKNTEVQIPLWPGGLAPVGPDQREPANAYLQIFRPKRPNGTAVLVCAGGGYGFNFWYALEGVGMAQWFSERGVTAAVLVYRLPRGNYHQTLSDVKRGMRFLRSKASDWDFDPEKVGIFGCSAGGHLATMASTKFDHGDPDATDPVERASSRPDFAVLIWPVISLGEHTHKGTRKGWLGINPSDNAVEEFSSHLQVTPETPPTFLTHAADDIMVPPINSELYYEALKKNGVEAEYLPLPKGGHGLRLLEGGMGGKNWEPWQQAAWKWLLENRFVSSKCGSPD
jgi:acetyl esterase/lipase